MENRFRMKDLVKMSLPVLLVLTVALQADSCDGGGDGVSTPNRSDTAPYMYGLRGDSADADHCNGEGGTFLIEKLGSDDEPIFAPVCASLETLPQGCETPLLAKKNIVSGSCVDGRLK